MKEESQKVLSVSELNRSIKSILNDRKELKNIWVKGEILNYSLSGSGHIYFNLKDTSSTIRCTFFYYQAQNYKGKKLKDGMEIQVYGSISVYDVGGYYNLNVNRIEELGKGDLLYQIEQLKQKLSEKGIFDPANKKPIPKYPKTLGIATALGGAAVEDIIRIAKERHSGINILIAPCLVQGEQAPGSIVSAIKELNNPIWEVDVIIAGRGGGSFEDLMAFNTEEVVMAFYNSNVPIISAVGHQVDNLLTDLVADISTPTPTAAAEFAVPDLEDINDFLEEMEDRFTQALKYKLSLSSEKLGRLSTKHIFEDPMILLTDRSLKLDEIISRIFLLGKNNLSLKKSLIQNFDNIKLLVNANFERYKKSYELVHSRVENFSPLLTLRRGYSVTRNKDRKVITSYSDVKIGEELELILDKGRIQVEVKKTYE